MTDSSGGFRERIEVPGESGILFPKDIVPEVPAGLSTAGPLDWEALDQLTKPEVPIQGVADRLGASAGEGIVTSEQLSDIQERLARIQSAQKSQKVAELLARIQALIAQEHYAEALLLLDEAIQAEPGQAPLYVLKAHCLLQTGALDEAYTVLERGIELASDLETVVILALMKRACLVRIARKQEQQVVDLVNQGRVEDALRFVEQELERMPGSIALRYHRCALLLLLGRSSEAESSARQALESASPGEQPLFADLLASIQMVRNLPHLERARALCRAGRNSEAMQALEVCREAIGASQRFRAFHAYLRERTSGAVGRLFLKGAKELLSGDTLQGFLLWLLSEEIAQGVDALKSGRHDAAVAAFQTARSIDSRCRLVRFLEASAIVRRFQAAIQAKQAPDLDHALAELDHAAELCQGMDEDPQFGQQSEGLRQVASAYSRQLRELQQELKQREKQAQPVKRLVDEFNSFMSELERRPIDSRPRLEGAEKRFHALRAKAGSLQPSVSDPQLKEVLRKLSSTIDGILQQLDDAKHGRAIAPASSGAASASGQLNFEELLPDTQECVRKMAQMVAFCHQHPRRNFQQESELESMKQAMEGLAGRALAEATDPREVSLLKNILQLARNLR